MSETFPEFITLEKLHCVECAGVFALTKDFCDRRRQYSGSFHCPYCQHSQGWFETEEKWLRKQLAASQEETRRAKCEIMAESQRKVEAQKAADKANRKLHRVKCGVCPDCNRSFQNLKRHIETKHK